MSDLLLGGDLPDRYLQYYTEADIARHRRMVSALSDNSPVAAEMGAGPRVTIVGRDYPYLFSMLTGLLASHKFDIVEGSVLTIPSSGGKVIVDTFEGRLGAGANRSWFDGFSEDLHEVYRILAEPGDTTTAARRFVAEKVSTAVAGSAELERRALLPVEVDISADKETGIGIDVRSENTPFFLFSLSSALAMQNLLILSVGIETHGSEIRDHFEVVDRSGGPPREPSKLNRIRLSILVTKQFTYFLDRAPDPFEALQRFDQLIADLKGEAEDAVSLLVNHPTRQAELARLLGASDFLWEDFIRVQHESILPMLAEGRRRKLLSLPEDEVEQELKEAVEKAEAFEGKVEALNSFKDRQAYLIDIDHILVRASDFFFLSRRLTALAEAVVRAAMALAWEETTGRHGVPRTAAGLEAEWCVLGLGKLGGRALGYASDIELLCVFSDDGESDGEKPIANRSFFEKLFRTATKLIRARREGIFRVDTRLRPYGNDGPLACKLSAFVRYYGAGGDAHSVERLALVRLRPIAGSESLGGQILAVRDEIVYAGNAIAIPAIRYLRRTQIEAKTQPDRLNAKFTPGGLVDLEYNVQILQVIHGRQDVKLRTPGIHDALRELARIGTIESSETEAMIEAYRFLRRLINGLRMLRGNATDLFLPAFGSLEFRHLARRIGYDTEGELTAEQQLEADFETHTAGVRSFVERHLGREAIPGEAPGTVADVALSDVEAGKDERSHSIMRAYGFGKPERAVRNVRHLAAVGADEAGAVRRRFLRLAVLAMPVIAQTADPDAALNHWERLVDGLAEPAEHYSSLLAQPRRMELLFTLLASSEFLARTLIQNTEFFTWVTNPAHVGFERSQAAMERDLYEEGRWGDSSDTAENGGKPPVRASSDEAGTSAASAAGLDSDRASWKDVLRLFRKRELTRIGLRDICLRKPLAEITREIASLARAVISTALARVWERMVLRGDLSERRASELAARFSLLAFGKLGANELNYSSDIDLLAVYEGRREDERVFAGAMRELVKDLNDFTAEGRAYRVDLRLRPYGGAGRLVYQTDTARQYYENEASQWEHQALLKLNTVAGSESVGRRFLESLKPAFIARWTREETLETIRRLRAQAVDTHTGKLAEGDLDVKNGNGGLRDIEFLVQGLQMIHSADHPSLLLANTLDALSALTDTGILSEETGSEIAEDYRFLRRVEHFLQLYGDNQLHVVPNDPAIRSRLARSIEPDRSSGEVLRLLDETVSRTNDRFQSFLENRATFS